MTELENAKVRKLIAQGKDMKEILEIMRKRRENPVEELFGILKKK